MDHETKEKLLLLDELTVSLQPCVRFGEVVEIYESAAASQWADKVRKSAVKKLLENLFHDELVAHQLTITIQVLREKYNLPTLQEWTEETNNAKKFKHFIGELEIEINPNSAMV